MGKKLVDIKINEIVLTDLVYKLGNIVNNKEYNIVLIDSVEVLNVHDTWFELRYRRKTTCDDPFNIQVEFKIEVMVIDVEQLKENNESINEFANRKKTDIISRINMPSRASLLISNVTRETGNTFVSIPTFIDNNLN